MISIGCLTFGITFAGSKTSRLRNHGDSACARSSGGIASHPLSVITAAWMLLLQLDLGLPLRLRRLHLVEQVPLLLEDRVPRRCVPGAAISTSDEIFFSRAAASIATAPPSLCPTTAIRLGSMSLRLASHLTAVVRSSA